jgi:hypothetical protein
VEYGPIFNVPPTTYLPDTDLDSRAENSYCPPLMRKKAWLPGWSLIAASPLIWGITLGAIPALSAATIQGMVPADGPEESVLLLRSGGLLQGRVTRTDDRYIVELPGGGVSVKVRDVQRHCRDVIEAYGVKRTLARPDCAQDHIELAQWCQKVGLPRHAGEELAEAKAIDPSHPMLPLVERQLRVAAQSAAQSQEQAPPSKPAVSGPTTADLDRMVHAMPPRTVETFTQVIQPMLVSHCGSAACHGPGSPSKLQLFRPPVGSLPSRRLTQRNLYSVLEWVNRDDPAKSPLVSVPTRPHGSTRSPIFSNNQNAIYGQLFDWCSRVSRAQGPVVHASYEEPVGAGHNEPGSASAARAAIRAQRNQERDAAKATSRQRTGQAFPPLSAKPAGAMPQDEAFPLTRRGGVLPRSDPTEPSDQETGDPRPPDQRGQP